MMNNKASHRLGDLVEEIFADIGIRNKYGFKPANHTGMDFPSQGN
jgi:hypothetical protein